MADSSPPFGVPDTSQGGGPWSWLTDAGNWLSNRVREANQANPLITPGGGAGFQLGPGSQFATEAMLGTFGGPGAATADLAALDTAKTMEAGGAKPLDIHQNTGWFRGPDQKWRYEISDQPMQTTPQLPSRPANAPGGISSGAVPPADTMLSRMITHPELFQAYPQLERYYTTFGRLPPGAAAGFKPGAGATGNRGLFSFGANYPPNPADVVHEIQHAVQHIEGFEAGGSPRGIMKDPALQPHFIQEYERLIQPINFDDYKRLVWDGSGDARSGYQQYVTRHIQDLQAPNSAFAASSARSAATNIYERLAGESEARLSADRLRLTQAKRLEIPPFSTDPSLERFTYDVPWSEMIMRTAPWAP